MAKMGELKRAAQVLGVTSSTLRQQGWATASPPRVQAVMDDPPGWLIVARQNRSATRVNGQRRRERESTATRLGVAVCVVKKRDIASSDVSDLLAAPPHWLIAAQEQRRAQVERELADTQRRAEREAQEAELAEAHLRVIKDRGDTDAWAARVLHDAGIHSIDLGDGTVAPVLPPALKVVH